MSSPERTARYQLLYDLGCAFAARLDLDELVPLVITKCREAFDAEGAAVLLHDAERGELFFPYVTGDDPEVAGRLTALRFPADRGFAGSVLTSGKPLRVDDVATDPRFYGEVDHQTGITTRSLLCAPLTTRQGTIGVLQVLNRRGGQPFADEDLGFLGALAGSVAVAMENARLYGGVKTSAERLRAQVGALRRDLARHDRFGDTIGTSRAMVEVFRLMERAAASPITVLVEGETGTGKELVARGIHRASPRGDGSFLAVNCAALPETLLESELFGHRRGAFTGATQDRQGLFEAASGGTVFLDEVGEMPLAMQAKLLRVLQEGEVVPVGDNRPRRVDVRVISATNRDLTAEVAAKQFRQDLYYRLAAFPISLPPLRERREDVPLLADRFLAESAARHKRTIAGIHPSALARLVHFAWPGNIRELQNEIERAVALAGDGETIGLQHLSAKLGASGPAATPGADGDGADAVNATSEPSSRPVGPLRRARAAFEARYIAEVLAQQNGNVTRAAQVLGLSRVMLQKKMKDYGLR